MDDEDWARSDAAVRNWKYLHPLRRIKRNARFSAHILEHEDANEMPDLVFIMDDEDLARSDAVVPNSKYLHQLRSIERAARFWAHTLEHEDADEMPDLVEVDTE
jgi:hypothetical protein